MKVEVVKKGVVGLLLILIVFIMGFYYLSDQTSITANVIQDSGNKLPGKDSLGGYVCESGTLLYLPFDSDFDDKSKNSFESKSKNLILVNGKFSNASNFKPGSNFKIPLNLKEEAITLSFWIKMENNNSKILDISSDNKSLISIEYKSRLLFNHANSPIAFTSKNDGWHNIVILFNTKEKRLKLFLDNSSIGLTYLNKEEILSDTLSLGGNNFTGLIDDLIIYNFILNEDELSSLYNNGTGKSACVYIPECIDSDLGINQNEKGIVFTKKESKEDYCLLEGDVPKYVNEYYCQGSQIASKVMDCPKNCFNGACTQ